MLPFIGRPLGRDLIAKDLDLVRALLLLVGLAIGNSVCADPEMREFRRQREYLSGLIVGVIDKA